MIETVVGLMAMLFLFCGFLQIIRLTSTHMSALCESREEVADRMFNDSHYSYGSFLTDWGAGNDEKRHTADDVAQNGNMSSENIIFDELCEDNAKNFSDRYALTSDKSSIYIVKSYPFIKKWFGLAEWDIETESFMTWCSGIESDWQTGATP